MINYFLIPVWILVLAILIYSLKIKKVRGSGIWFHRDSSPIVYWATICIYILFLFNFAINILVNLFNHPFWGILPQHIES